MEPTKSSTHRASFTGQQPQAWPPQIEGHHGATDSHEPGPARAPAATRDRMLPPEDLAAPAPTDSGTDYEKVAKNAAASAVALGSCFGTMSALNNAVRATPGMPAAVKAFTGLLPSAGVFPTPWVEDGMRHALSTTATLPTEPSLAHDAVAGATLFLFNRACARSAYIPKFRAATPAGMAATVLQATAASIFAGAATELTAQWMNDKDRPSDDTAAAPAPIDNPRKATGRLLSQVPAATLQTGLALVGKPLPPALSLLPMGVVTGGWCFRRVLIPPETSPGDPPRTPGGGAPLQPPLTPMPEIPPG